MQSVDEDRDLGHSQEQREKSLEEAAFTIPRSFRLTAFWVIVAIFLGCLLLLAWDFWDNEPDADPTKTDLIGFLFILLIAGAICALEWEKLPFRISKIGPIELSEVVSGQAHEHAIAFDELRKRIEKLEEVQRKLAAQNHPSIVAPPASPDPQELEGLLERFFARYDSWSFSPLRIAKWGSLQPGFEELGDYQLEQIRRVLQAMVAEGKLETRVSQKGNTLYRILKA